MWEGILDRLPDWAELICAFAAFAVPYSIFKINTKLHEFGDPPWKKEESPKRPEDKDTSEG
ncbi:hypothetical protein ACFO3D_14625 [Virgibacillus kekensis]|uniref:Uncharacterized protein n=1 Tax=Virgibacillus kekensis TaxID=202261 RepID=A0ABV9DKP8_9BACI